MASLSQGSYVAKILEVAGMSKCNPTKTPLEVGMKLSKKDAGETVDATEYRSIIGSLRCLVNTRPDHIQWGLSADTWRLQGCSIGRL